MCWIQPHGGPGKEGPITWAYSLCRQYNTPTVRPPGLRSVYILYVECWPCPPIDILVNMYVGVYSLFLWSNCPLGLLPVSRPASRETKYLLSKLSNPLQPAQLEDVLGHHSMDKVSWVVGLVTKKSSVKGLVSWDFQTLVFRPRRRICRDICFLNRRKHRFSPRRR